VRPIVFVSAMTVVAMILLLAVVVRALESGFAFFPLTGETETPSQFGVGYQSLSVRTRDGEQLHGWKIPSAAAKARVLYFHGNGGNLSVWTPILVGIARRGYTITAFDYRGYGRSSGRPSERGLYADVDAALDWDDGARGVPVIYWGRSLGAAMAAYAATRTRPDGLILEAGFPNAWSLVRGSAPLALVGLFSSYRFPTASFVRRAGCPVLVMHGDDDRVIPFALGRALFDEVPEPKRFVPIRGGDHNDASPADADAYWSAVRAFVETLRR
jgi:fermentation-respiration switch protein FrsA (DUF1100 family)